MVQTRAKRALRRVGLVHDGVHTSCVHTFCSHVARGRAPLHATPELVGHADLTMTQRYKHLSPAALDSAIGLLEQPAGPARSGRNAADATDGPKDSGNINIGGNRPADVKTINKSGQETGGEAGIRTLGTGLSPYNGLANRRFRPLSHLTLLAPLAQGEQRRKVSIFSLPASCILKRERRHRRGRTES